MELKIIIYYKHRNSGTYTILRQKVIQLLIFIYTGFDGILERESMIFLVVLMF